MKRLFCLFIGIFLLTGCSQNSWILDLPNDYLIKKTNANTVQLGKEIDGKFETDKIGVDKYIESFKYGEEFVVLRCLEKTDTITILYYIIDTNNQLVYGPYDTDSEYEAVVDGIIKEEDSLSKWYKTSGDKPNIVEE